MNLAKLYICHLDKYPDRLFFVYRSQLSDRFESCCKKCMQSGVNGSSKRFDSRRVYILQCPRCKITKKMELQEEDMKIEEKILSAYREIQFQRHWR